MFALAFTCGALLWSATPAAPTPSEVLRADLDGDGAAERVEVYVNPQKRRGFLRIERDRKHWTSPIYPMWKAALADLDGDGRSEVILGIWSDQARHGERRLHRTVHVLAWRGRGLRALWRGSALARPLEDIAPAELDATVRVAELLALERVGGRCYLTAYRFDGFGFRGLGRHSWIVDAPRACGGVSLCGGSCVVTAAGKRRAKLRQGRLELSPWEGSK